MQSLLRGPRRTEHHKQVMNDEQEWQLVINAMLTCAFTGCFASVWVSMGVGAVLSAALGTFLDASLGARLGYC